MGARPHVQDMLFPLIHPHHLNTLSIYQHMGSPMKMIMRNLFKVSQTWSTIADTLRWEASACELCITPRCFVSCCVSQPLCITHPLCIVYCTCGLQTAVYHTLAPFLHHSWLCSGWIWSWYEAEQRADIICLLYPDHISRCWLVCHT